MYTRALGQDAVERYAMFLVSLSLSADINERRLALTRAREHGLDMERIAIFTAERTIDNAFRVSCVFEKFFFIMFLVCAERRIYVGFTSVERSSSVHYFSTGST